MLCADASGRITFARATAGENEIFLQTLLNLELMGYVRRERGRIPMLPFHLSTAGQMVKNAMLHPVNSQFSSL